MRTHRRARRVACRPVGVHLGLDLGGTNAKCAVVDASLRVLATDSRPNGAAGGPDAVLASVAELGRATAAPFGEIGPPCGCGNRGCLDRMAGADAIAAAAGRATVAAAAEAARAGDAAAIAAFAQAGEYVGRVLAGAIVLLWPQRVVVGGGVADA